MLSIEELSDYISLTSAGINENEIAKSMHRLNLLSNLFFSLAEIKRRDVYYDIGNSFSLCSSTLQIAMFPSQGQVSILTEKTLPLFLDKVKKLLDNLSDAIKKEDNELLLYRLSSKTIKTCLAINSIKLTSGHEII